MKLTKPQKQISDDLNRFRVVAAGRRFGKSYLSINELAKFARHPHQRCLYTAPTYRQAKTVIWDDLKTLLSNVRWIRKVNESDLTVTLVNGSTISVRSTDNFDALRGGKYDFIVMDEFADSDPQSWYSVLRPTLSDRGGHALFIGSPKGRNHFYDLWVSAHNTPDWAAWQFTTLDGGNVPESEIHSAQRDLDTRTFEQEYLAQFVNYSGVIYYAFDPAKTIPFTDAIPQTLHVGMDFNTNPMSAVIAVVTDQITHVFDEIMIYSSNTHEMCEEIRRRYPKQNIVAYPDASGSAMKTSANGISDHIILKNSGFRIQSGKTNPPVDLRITTVNSGLEHHRLLIDPGCKNLIQCLTKQTYKPGTRIPDKSQGHDHMNDALGYLMYHTQPIGEKPGKTHTPLRRNSGRML